MLLHPPVCFHNLLTSATVLLRRLCELAVFNPRLYIRVRRIDELLALRHSLASIVPTENLISAKKVKEGTAESASHGSHVR